MNKEKEKWDVIYQNNDEKALPWLSNEWSIKSIPHINEVMKNYTTNAELLDYGAGSGHIGEYYARLGHNVTFADISDKCIDKKMLKDLNCRFFRTDEPKEIDEKFTVIICWGVFHHLDEKTQEKFLEQFHQMLSPWGTLILGGWDEKDPNNVDGIFPSKVSEDCVYSINHLKEDGIFQKLGFRIISSEEFKFKEPKLDEPERVFRYFTLAHR